RLYEVDGAPVVLFYGARPQWRPLAPGISPGPDVAQLRANLIALGYGTGLAVSDYYDDATAAAVADWQAAAGLPVTGTVPLGQVVYASGSLRVAAVSAVLGAAPQTGAPLLTATSPVPAVLVPLPVSQEYLVRAGDQVTVTLPDGVTTMPGVITAIAPVAAQDTGSPYAGASSGPGNGSGNGPGNGSGNGQATVQMTVKLTHPGAAGVIDQEPVTVNIVSAQAHGVLAVPVSALVALAGGGYAVDVVSGASGATRTLVPVRTGLFASTLVQVSAPGLRAGQEVEVPAS
ncbi:MAG TPA: peptidoglycan-binding protein, partial [Streptosporangiaceae bacterium]|nr:peptidoglycan-binding protein [Streptosporangiaceae bacterium]